MQEAPVFPGPGLLFLTCFWSFLPLVSTAVHLLVPQATSLELWGHCDPGHLLKRCVTYSQMEVTASFRVTASFAVTQWALKQSSRSYRLAVISGTTCISSLELMIHWQSTTFFYFLCIEFHYVSWFAFKEHAVAWFQWEMYCLFLFLPIRNGTHLFLLSPRFPSIMNWCSSV